MEGRPAFIHFKMVKGVTNDVENWKTPAEILMRLILDFSDSERKGLSVTENLKEKYFTFSDASFEKNLREFGSDFLKWMSTNL